MLRFRVLGCTGMRSNLKEHVWGKESRAGFGSDQSSRLPKGCFDFTSKVSNGAKPLALICGLKLICSALGLAEDRSCRQQPLSILLLLHILKTKSLIWAFFIFYFHVIHSEGNKFFFLNSNFLFLYLPGVAKQQPISSSAPMIHSSNAALGFNKLESPDDSEQCAAEYRVRMWIIYTHKFPWRAHCHIHLMCACRAHAFSYGAATLPHFCAACYSLMNKSIHNGGFMDSVQSIEWFNSSQGRGAT